MSVADLHQPSLPSTSSSSSAPLPQQDGHPVPTVQSELQRLSDKRGDIQAQLDVYFSVLSSNRVGMDDPLVDNEGFPRSDIDVAGVRTARMWVHRLKNDLKRVMGELEQVVQRGLPRGEEGESATGAGEGGESMQVDGEEEEAWAKVDAVAPGSPADAAGLKRDDLLISLGPVTASNNDNLRAVAALVGRSEGVELELVVRRGGERVDLRLKPSKWSGRGLLGCHIVPYSASTAP
ncbi:hypothetical protein JCM8547_007590 [Rhodosporidiobolus lusitaniae]